MELNMGSTVDRILCVAFVTVGVTILVGLVGVGTVTVAAQGSVTGCEVIDSPGEYSLENDVSAGADTETCIEITSGDVVFDGQGNAVVGVDNASSTGVAASGDLATAIENVTVRNVEVRDWGTGVSFSFVNESAISGVEARDVNGTGISLEESSRNLVSDSTARENEDGVTVASFFLAAQENTVRNNDIEDNNASGVGFFLGAENNTVEDNRIENNRDSGFVSFLSAGSTVTENTVSGSSVGVATFLSAEDEVSDNDVTNNDVGVVGVVAVNQTIEDNRINDNNEAGVMLLNSFGTEVVGNEIKNNSRDFVELILPEAEQEADDEFGSGTDDGLSDIPDEPDNVVERTEFGSSGVETVLSFESNNATVSGVSPGSVPAPPEGATDLGLYFDATDGTDTDGLEGGIGDIEEGQDIDGDMTGVEQPKNPFVDVDVQFEDSAVPDADESNLSLWRYDEERGAWEELATSTVDTQNDIVSANATEFGTFGVFEGGDDGSGNGADGGGSLSLDNPFGDANGEPLGVSNAADVLFEWNQNNGTVDGVNIPLSDMADFLFGWNQAR